MDELDYDARKDIENFLMGPPPVRPITSPHPRHPAHSKMEWVAPSSLHEGEKWARDREGARPTTVRLFGLLTSWFGLSTVPDRAAAPRVGPGRGGVPPGHAGWSVTPACQWHSLPWCCGWWWWWRCMRPVACWPLACWLACCWTGLGESAVGRQCHCDGLQLNRVACCHCGRQDSTVRRRSLRPRMYRMSRRRGCRKW